MTPPTPEHAETPARRRPWRWLLDLTLVLIVLLGLQWWKARPLASGEAPPLSGTNLQGQALDLATYRGQPLLVHFWATWCPVCRLGDRSIDAIARDHRVITVALQSGEPAEILQFMATEGLSFDVIPDESGALSSEWGVSGVPATFILDSEGRIAHSTVGFSTEWGLRARLWSANGLL